MSNDLFHAKVRKIRLLKVLDNHIINNITMNHQHFAFWRNQQRLTSLVMGVVFLMTALPAFAQFQPRDRKPASENTRAGGSRGCSITGIPVTQLAPWTFIGKTASTRPMLAWYMSSSQKVRFRLFEFDSANSVKIIGKVKEIPTIVGINKLKLPLDYPELTVGKTYLWQITIDCESNTILNHAEFTVINPQSLPKKRFTTRISHKLEARGTGGRTCTITLLCSPAPLLPCSPTPLHKSSRAQALRCGEKSGTSISESVNYYAENELWYEALEEALKATSNGKLGKIGATLVKELAQSEILTGKDADKNNIHQRIENLQKIASERM